MHTAIICLTGSELTRGETRDRNGPFLATELTVLGVRVDEVLLVPDDPALIRKAVEAAIPRADIILMSGGLGPTADDHTVAVLAQVFGRKVLRHPEAVHRMKARAAARGWTEDRLPANYWKQAEVLEGAGVLLNPVGLAPGMILPTPRGFAAVLPGVPRELEAMFREGVVPELHRRFSLTPPRVVRAKVLGLPESVAEARIQALGIDWSRIEYGISARPGELLVKFLAHDPGDHPALDSVRARLAAEFGDDLIFLPEGLTDASGKPIAGEHAAIVHALLLGSGETVATAESCTGGLIARRLTDHPGSSAYFLGSVVAYHDRTKTGILGVPPSLLETHGAVSAEVCEAMARGAIELFGSTRALAVTGVAGPGGGTPSKPVGLVHIGHARGQATPAEVILEEHRFTGDRDVIRSQAALRALELLRRSLPRG